jgi:hypothetical protein
MLYLTTTSSHSALLIMPANEKLLSDGPNLSVAKTMCSSTSGSPYPQHSYCMSQQRDLRSRARTFRQQDPRRSNRTRTHHSPNNIANQRVSSPGAHLYVCWHDSLRLVFVSSLAPWWIQRACHCGQRTSSKIAIPIVTVKDCSIDRVNVHQCKCTQNVHVDD